LLSKLLLGDRQILMQLNELGDGLREVVHDLQVKAMMALARGVGSFDELSARERNQRVRVLIGMFVAATQLVDENVRLGLSIEVFARHLAKIIVSGVGAK
jgi:hypothetical protein